MKAKQDADGNLYMEYGEGTNSHHYNNVETGECIWPDQIEGEETWTDVALGAGEGMSEERFPVRDGQGNVTGDFGTGWYNTSYNYYSSSDGKLHCVDRNGNESTYDLVGDGTNAVIYKDSDGSYKWVWGVVEEGEESAKDRYRREVEEWEILTKSLQVDDDGNYFYYRTVKGPWQLRTDINDVTTPQDNVQWIVKMAQKVFGNNFFYDEPDFTGETKVLSPSLTRIGDFFRQELKTIEAGLRIFYSFKANQMIFQVWRGLDRTQDENAPGADDDVQPVLMAARSTFAGTADVHELPSGYIELEYIESTGAQYIDTGFVPNQDTRLVLDIESASQMGEQHVAGARASLNSKAFCVMVTNSLVWRSDYGSNQVTVSGAPRTGRFTIDKNKAQTTIGSVSASNTPQTFSSGCNMYLLAVNTNGSISQYASIKLHSAQVYNNGTLVRDFTPVRRVNDSVVGLYDSVGGQFYGNLGSGSFSAGPEVPPEPGTVPDGYTEVEYIDSDGASYIDTGFDVDERTTYEVDFAPTGGTANNGVVGADSSWEVNGNAIFVGYAEYGAESTSFDNDGRHTIAINGNHQLTIDGAVEHTFNAQTFESVTAYVMAVNRNGAPEQPMTGRLYSCSIGRGGSKVRNFVPVWRDADHEPGLFDTVYQQFYGNSGTGTLTAGPVVVKPIEDQLTYYPNSLTATGSTPPTAGYQGQPVVVAQCGFIDSQRAFTGWNTSEGGTGTTYQPGSEYILTDGSDALYAQWTGGPGPDPGPDVPDGNAWAVFSDKWGSLYDYSASVDDSNYRNLCYVLHEFDEPVWDDSGHPVVETVTGELMTEILGYRVKYTSQRGSWVVRLEDDYEDRETWLDKRDEKPEQDQDWPRDMQEEMPDVSGVTKESYDQFKTSLQNEGRAYLEENYPIVKNLDTGTLNMSEYLTGFDLGDKVDMEVSTLGLKETARIIEVDEVHESGNSEIHLVMGEEMVTSTRKAGLN